MKEKARISLMICRAANGENFLLAIVGKSVTPRYFYYKKEPPQMSYRGQKMVGSH